ncbi:conserved hypothetical protein [Trichinella spiralis]|uniref:hypothetical protein n=1 Tax=Trichinella spiralis TaxID=6334 RepID=UPI0001EFC187|nr:conserved hypothetical protein [Trichinella spiralis]
MPARHCKSRTNVRRHRKPLSSSGRVDRVEVKKPENNHKNNRKSKYSCVKGHNMNRQIPLRSVADKATLIRLQFLAKQLQCQKLKKAIWRESSDLELLVICKSPGTRASRLAGLISFQLPTIKRASIGLETILPVGT